MNTPRIMSDAGKARRRRVLYKFLVKPRRFAWRDRLAVDMQHHIGRVAVVMVSSASASAKAAPSLIRRHLPARGNVNFNTVAGRAARKLQALNDLLVNREIADLAL